MGNSVIEELGEAEVTMYFLELFFMWANQT